MTTAREIRILLVDDDETFCRVFGGALAEEGFSVRTAANGLDGLELMNRRSFDVVLIDLRMPQMEGISLVDEMKRRHPGTIPIILTGFGSVSKAVEAMRAGAVDMLSKTATVDQVALAIRRAMDERRRLRADSVLGDALLSREAFFGMVGRSNLMLDLFRQIERFQDSDDAVLILGESGTGKELVARALHTGGRRRNRPLIAVNCASLRENFAENELFGHVKGAFTGALDSKKGLFELADGGTLHIDEIGEMPEPTQAALLRVLDSGTFRPLGALRDTRVDVRIVASTNKPLDRLEAEGGFRSDLFYRLNVCRLEVPPLRMHREDILLLVNHFLDTYRTNHPQPLTVTAEALSTLMAHDWPGNVRELFNCLSRAALLADNGLIELAHLGQLHWIPTGNETPDPRAEFETTNMTLDGMERQYLEKLMRREQGNIAAVARVMGVDPTTVRRKLRRWQMEGSSWRAPSRRP